MTSPLTDPLRHITGLAGHVWQILSGNKGPFIIPDPESLVGRGPVGSGSCAAICQSSTTISIGLTQHGRAGANVVENRQWIPKGTVIASFVCGCYQNMPHDNHVAIFLSATDKAIKVVDQWHGQPPNIRHIPVLADHGDPSNNARPFHVVYVSEKKIACPGIFSAATRAKLSALDADDKKRWALLDKLTRDCVPAKPGPVNWN
jgi:hypothetical protein